MNTSELKSGSALLITLLVMSLMTALVLTFTAQVRLELRRVQNRVDRHQAQSHARLGLELALARLQELAGEDARVTARGEIRSGTLPVGGDFWTGVWDSQTAAFLGWLASGDTPNPATLSTGEERLIGPAQVGNRPDRFVHAPRETIPGRGGFAWLVSDQGVMASLGQSDRLERLSIPGFQGNRDGNFNSVDGWRLDRLRKWLPQLADIAADVPGTSSFTHRGTNAAQRTAREATRERLSRAAFLPDLATPGGGTDNTRLPTDFLQQHAHDFTLHNAFTLSNTLDGTLRQDLTHLRRLNSTNQMQLNALFHQPQWDLLTPAIHSFVNFDRNVTLTPNNRHPTIQPNVRPGFMTEPITYSTAPIATEIVWNAGMGIRSGPGSGVITRDIILYFYGIVEMLNPFSKALALENFGEPNHRSGNPGAPSNLLVRISNFPSVQITNENTGTTMSLDLSELVIALPSNSFNNHEPGWMRPNFSPTNSFTSITGGSGVFAIKVGEFPETPQTRDPFRVEFGVSDLRIEIAETTSNPIRQEHRATWAFFLIDRTFPSGVPVFPPTNDPSSGPRTTQIITVRNWGGFTIEHGSSDPERFVQAGASMMNRPRLNAGNVNFGFHGKFVDEWVELIASDNRQMLDDLMILSDLRRTTINVDMLNPESGDGAFFDVRDPSDIQFTNFNRRDDFFAGDSAGPGSENRRARLFDLPTQEPVSIGILNQMKFDGFGFQPLANLPEGRDPPNLSGDGSGPSQSLHNFADRYFFSTLPENVATWDGEALLPNVGITASGLEATTEPDLLASPASAIWLLHEGGLNINSTSVPAWRAFLKSRVLDEFVYTRRPNQPSETLSNTRQTLPNPGHLFMSQPFSGDMQISSNSAPTFSFAGQNDISTLANGLRAQGAHPAFIQGVRAVTDVQMDQLAREIVREITRFTNANNRPFLSITEFLNEGVFPNAIARVPSLNTSDNGTSRRIPTLAPAYFSAGKLLNHLAPGMFSRSDTFVIHSVGYVQPQGGTRVSEARLEAVVQRIPHETVGGHGRRFVIQQIRWLPSDAL